MEKVGEGGQVRRLGQLCEKSLPLFFCKAVDGGMMDGCSIGDSSIGINGSCKCHTAVGVADLFQICTQCKCIFLSDFSVIMLQGLLRYIRLTDSRDPEAKKSSDEK